MERSLVLIAARSTCNNTRFRRPVCRRWRIFYKRTFQIVNKPYETNLKNCFRELFQLRVDKFTKRKQTVLKDFCEIFRDLSFNCGPKSGPKSFGARNWIFDDFTVSQRKHTSFLKFAKPITEKYLKNTGQIFR